jgi:superoxide dismutase, Fe-Mn family
MDRKDFFNRELWWGSYIAYYKQRLCLRPYRQSKINKLVDANGNYIHQPLPYNASFLEPRNSHFHDRTKSHKWQPIKK